MAKKLMIWKTKGMNKDLSVSAFNPEFAFENMNLRLSTNEGNTLLSWVNERGTEGIKNSSNVPVTLTGTPIGTAIINHNLVLFTTTTTVDTKTSTANGTDYIYVLRYVSNNRLNMNVDIKYSGPLNFSPMHPLETLVSYESKSIQKVYWVDGVNQPRLINIAGDNILGRDPSYFDFVNELALNETITVKKLLGASGMFAPGVIQYAFTYYNKNGQETNIFYTTPLYYISNSDRGVSPEGKVENAFQIKIEGVDSRFDYLRIYSIQRTSIDGTPICKRIQDIATKNLTNSTASYTDTGLNGNNIDPTELLYKGGEAITASTLEQKDGTLFLGDIKLIAKHKPDDISQIAGNTDWDVTGNSIRAFQAMRVSYTPYSYSNQLTSYKYDLQNSRTTEISVPCGGFKRGDKYRCGVQFQHITGKWSDPIWIKDEIVGSKPSLYTIESEGEPVLTIVKVPTLTGTISNSGDIQKIYNAGYRRARAVVVFPNIQDRYTLCQGVLNPTMYTENRRSTDLYAQSSWFFRPQYDPLADWFPVDVNSDGTGSGGALPIAEGTLLYTNRSIADHGGYSPEGDLPHGEDNIRRVEIQGDFSGDSGKNKFKIDNSEVLTFHSPDVEFDDRLQVIDFNNTTGKKVGDVQFGVSKYGETMSDISIQTESPTIAASGTGFVQKAITDYHNRGIVSGLFYEDWLVDDMGGSDNFDHFEKYGKSYENSPIKYMVYLWNKEGSLNNDVNRPVNTGTPSAILKKKVVSNLRYATTDLYDSNDSGYISSIEFSCNPQLFMSDDPTILKIGDNLYQGNIDVALIPTNADGLYFAFDGSGTLRESDIETSFASNNWWKTHSVDPNNNTDGYGLWKRENGAWIHVTHAVSGSGGILLYPYDVGKYYIDLVSKKEIVKMKYKSTAHLVLRSSFSSDIWKPMRLPIVEITKDPGNTIFGGTSADAFQENTWIPCGEPVPIWEYNNGVPTPKSEVSFEYSYGDTYFQRWDCLKTYAYTPEDTNQVVEIGSFMLETHTNIDGRYDRNRGQINNLNMSPRNFNLLNPVYSQIDNFFSYKIMPEDTYKDIIFPNQITWSKTKESEADVDQWTNVTLASILELDGDKGKLNKLIRLNDQLLAFQDTGFSQLLYNENVQISSTDGVPIEIANSGKVQGKRYLSNTIGCSNKWSMATTPAGIYFMDSHDKSIYLFNGQLINISNQGGFASWAKNKISLTGNQWRPDFTTSDFVAYYDKLNQDVLWINSETALAWSEKLGAFTSFYSYEGTPFFCNLDDTGVWISKAKTPNANNTYYLWKHQAGDYCKFFNQNRPYWMTLVGNPEPLVDKIFTNLEFRATVDTDGTVSSGEFTPLLPFNSLETWNEYQHGLATLLNKSGHAAMLHNLADKTASLKRKFRIWRCDIPRDNVDVDAATEIPMGIFRKAKHPIDRMRNPWLYLKLTRDAENTMLRSEIHDLMMTYFT